MNRDHLVSLIEHFNLGKPVSSPKRIYGGLMHIMWRLDTEKGSYGIKQLSEDINLSDECVMKNYELSESIASRFAACGILAVSAIESIDKHIFIKDDVGFLVYPWIDAKILDQDAVSEKHAIKIVEMLSKIHHLNLNEPKITKSVLSYTNKKIIKLIDKSERLRCPFSESLRKNKANILYSNDAYHNAMPILKMQSVMSHCDIHQTNVLWNSENNPILIDWESVCKINPTYDVINTAFSWSGITSRFDSDLFFKMIRAYQREGGILNKDHVVSAIYGAFAWINWLVYSIERYFSFGECENQNIGVDQVNKTLETILQLQRVVPEVIKKMDVMCQHFPK